MTASPSPPSADAQLELSVVIATDGAGDLGELLAALRAQTARKRLELVVVAPAPGNVIGVGMEDVFGGVCLVAANVGQSLSAARAAGVRAATTPLVVFTESHSFPEPDWAQALIDAHAGPWAAVGPAMLNATPDEPRTWGQLFVDYGPWVAPVSAGTVVDLPGHGSAYKRSLLLEYGDELEGMLAAEWNLHQDLRMRGHRLYLEPAAATRHLNMTQVVPSFKMWQRYSRDLAAGRSRAWPTARRALYALATPVIFLKRLAVTLHHLARVGRLDVLPAALSPMLSSLAGSAVGELAGYASGRDPSEASELAHYDLHRERYVDTDVDWTAGGRR
jgi:Glycosyltransferase like family 2